MSSATKKVEKIRQIVQLKQFMRRWKSLSPRRGHRPGEADNGSGSSSGRPVPPGFLAVYVGREKRRFVIASQFLNFPVFTALLKQAEEEFGFSSAGGLTLPCPVDFFRRVVELLNMDECKYRDLSLDGFMELLGAAGLDLACFRHEMGSDAEDLNGLSLLSQKARV